MPTVHLLDYVAGNIRSLVNAIEKVGYQVEWIKSPEDVQKAEVLPLQPHQRVFPTALGTDVTDRLPRNSFFPELVTSVTASVNSTTLDMSSPSRSTSLLVSPSWASVSVYKLCLKAQRRTQRFLVLV